MTILMSIFVWLIISALIVPTVLAVIFSMGLFFKLFKEGWEWLWE